MKNSNITFEDTYVITNHYKNFSLPKCLAYLEHRGKEVYGPGFYIKNEHFLAIQKIISFATHAEKYSTTLGIDLKKGLLISGPEGCGKTAIMHLCKPFFGKRFAFELHSSKSISFDYARLGFEALHSFLHYQYKYTRPKTYCFDDFGAESIQKHFGNECEVMKEILEARHRAFLATGVQTHLITPLTPSELEHKYGTRLRNQLRSMCNLVSF